MSQSQIDRNWNLSRDEFADAIAKGLGRAFLYVKNHGLDRVKDLFLNACLHAIAYDPQCESQRDKWLLAMFLDSQYHLEFKTKILASLAVEEDTWDLLQLCRLARNMALAGDSDAGEALTNFVYGRADRWSSDDWIGVDELIEVRGIDSAITLARIYGGRLLANPDDNVPDTLSFFTNMTAVEQETFNRLVETDELVASYNKYLIDERISAEKKRSQRSLTPSKISLERIIDLARNKKYGYPSVYMRFGTQATPEELATIFELLLSEPDEDICLRLLWVFWKIPLLKLDDRLFEWANGQNELLRTSAIRVIAQTSDERVYQLGRIKLAERQVSGADSDSLDLFINNYHLGDAEIILDALDESIIEREDIHAIGGSIIDISKQQSNPELAILLDWIYDRTPCSHCRVSIVEELEKYQQVSERIRAEYLFDATQFGKD